MGSKGLVHLVGGGIARLRQPMRILNCVVITIRNSVVCVCVVCVCVCVVCVCGGVCVCVCVCMCDLETSTIRRTRPAWAVAPQKKFFFFM